MAENRRQNTNSIALHQQSQTGSRYSEKETLKEVNVEEVVTLSGREYQEYMADK